jgi:hypothetical protein
VIGALAPGAAFAITIAGPLASAALAVLAAIALVVATQFDTAPLTCAILALGVDESATFRCEGPAADADGAVTSRPEVLARSPHPPVPGGNRRLSRREGGRC